MFAIVSVASAQSNDAQAEILRADQIVDPDSYYFAYQTSNGISAQEQGQLKQIGAEAGIAAQGSYSWTSPEGQQFQVNYVSYK